MPNSIFTFDGPNRLLILKTGVTSVGVGGDLYGNWKEEYLLSDNAKYSPAFRTVGGDAVSDTQNLGATFFLINGWKVRPQESNHTLDITGNIFTDPSGEAITVSTVGNFNVLVRITVSNLIDTIAVGSGVTAQDKLDIANTVWAEILEGTFTAEQMMRLAAAAAAGKLSGAGTTNVKIRDLSDTKDRVDATVDSPGNRTSVTLNVTP